MEERRAKRNLRRTSERPKSRFKHRIGPNGTTIFYIDTSEDPDVFDNDESS